jgi:hypothetical protein
MSRVLFLRTSRHPKHVFNVHEGTIKVSGMEWGGLTSRIHTAITISRWSGNGAVRILANGRGHARDSGILVHGTGEDGAHGGIWPQSIESQIIEGGAGDFIMVEAGSAEVHAVLNIVTSVQQSRAASR